MRSDNLEITVEGGTPKELFKSLASAEEIFAADRHCGLCEGEELRHRFRQAGEFEFLELLCASCGATLALGQRKDGGLFPVRRGEDRKPLPHNGWSKWEPSTGGDEEERRRR